MHNNDNLNELLQFLNEHCDNSNRLCFKEYMNKNGNIIVVFNQKKDGFCIVYRISIS
jgi:hypothetical protein